MAYKKVNSDRYDEQVLIVKRLKRFNDPFTFSDGISLASYETDVELTKTTGDTLNTKIDEAEVASAAHVAAWKEVDRLQKALRACISGVKGRNSDEYVTAGGKRLSDVLALQEQKREEKKKAADEEAKKAAEEAIRKAAEEAVRKEAEEATKKTDKPS